MNKYSQKYIVTNDCMDLNYTLRPISAIMYFQDCFARYMTTKNLAAFDVITSLGKALSDFTAGLTPVMPRGPVS